MLVQSNEIAIIAVLNDACAARRPYDSKLDKISAPLTRPQLYEILVNYAYCNLSLQTRPTFSTTPGGHGFEISAALPDMCDFVWSQSPSYGELLRGVCARFVDTADPVKHQEVLVALGEGRYSWMFDGDDNFIPCTREDGLPVENT